MELSPSDMQHMADYIQYVADLRKTRRFKVLIEEKVTATWLVSQPPTTADLVLYTQDEIHVAGPEDAGKIPVDVVDNEQLLYYAACFAPLAPKAKGVTVHILQPYAGNYESWFVDTHTARPVHGRGDRTPRHGILAGDTTFGPSDHCKFCPANPHGRGAKGSAVLPGDDADPVPITMSTRTRSSHCEGEPDDAATSSVSTSRPTVRPDLPTHGLDRYVSCKTFRPLIASLVVKRRREQVHRDAWTSSRTTTRRGDRLLDGIQRPR